MNEAKPYDVDMRPVGLRISRVLTDYAQRLCLNTGVFREILSVPLNIVMDMSNHYGGLATQNMIFSVRLDLVFYHPTLLNTKFQFFDN